MTLKEKLTAKEGIFTNPWIIAIIALLCTLLWGSATPFIKIGYSLLLPDKDVPSTILFRRNTLLLRGRTHRNNIQHSEKEISLSEGREYRQGSHRFGIPDRSSVYLLLRWSCQYKRCQGNYTDGLLDLLCDPHLLAHLQAREALRQEDSRLRSRAFGNSSYQS